MLKAICFDMFDTLADPHLSMEKAESEALGITPEEWGRAVWESTLTHDRGLGIVKSPEELIERACGNLQKETSPGEREAVLKARCKRMRAAMTDIDPLIPDTVRRLKEKGYILAVISNADVCDIMYWSSSPLYPLFGCAVFSCSAGLLKPDPAIYELCLSKLGVRAEEAAFVGDGGSDELRGAKALGMMTVCTEYLRTHREEERKRIHESADAVISDFAELNSIF